MDFEGDAFISYAHLDDLELVEGRKGWVANFHRALEVRVAQLLGKQAHIWRDPKLSGNDLFAETLVERLKRVAVLVSVVTPRYLKSEWTLRELNEFFKAAEAQGGLKVRDKARIFKVLKQPVPLDRTPQELRAILGYEFFKTDPDTGKVRELDEVFGPDAQRDFWIRLDDLAHDLVALLEALEQDAQLAPFVPDQMQQNTSAAAGPPSSPASRAAGPSATPAPVAPLSPAVASAAVTRATVYLAETTSDVREQRESLRRDLQQHGFRVLPERAIPHESDEAMAAVQEDLAQSRLAIHLLGRHYGLVPEGATQSLAELQYELATLRSTQGRFSRLLWIPPGLQVDDARQRALLERVRMDPRIGTHADLLETSFEELRTAAQDWLERDLAPAVVAAASETGAAPQIYCIADQRDVDRIAPWCDALFDEHLEVIQPIFDGDEAELRAFHEETLSSCDGCLIFHGVGNELWLRRKLREIQKSPGYGRTKPLPTVWIALIGPRTPDKERFRTHEATVVPQWDGVSLEALRPFVAQLKAGRGYPFPGLRPFEADEEHLFFGRERDIDDLLRKLRTTRFVAVVGTSGSGKSSLVRSGLIPSLQGGFMAGAGSSWRIATMRPGEDPVGHLARALDARDVLGVDGEFSSTNGIVLDATLRRSTLGLVDAVRQARIPADENVLVLVDQFEELFRFRRSRQGEHSGDEAIAFVKLLLEATSQSALPIYIVITMRSDFIGDCMDFRGLPEAVNAGLYLVGRMTRDGLRSAVSGPAAVAGATVTPRLVNRILNDLGDDHDQLPIVQHALMRMWQFWSAARDGEPIDIDDYEAVGTTAHALSLHAEEAFLDCEAAGHAAVAERVLKALTDTFSDPRGIRRPTTIGELAAIADAPEAEVVQVVEYFRRADRSFLMPRSPVPLTSTTIVDLVHESLMRGWDRLIAWADEERAAAGFYARLSQAAQWHAQGAAGLWRNPELQLALQWRDENRPTAAWAARYDDRFEQAMRFLDDSRDAWQAAREAEERGRRQTLRRTQLAAAVLATMLVAAVALAVVARRESRRAEANLQLARTAVDESLSSADRSSARVGADTPAVEELRRELLDKAERFYQAFMYQSPRSEESRRDLAMAHLRLGHIHRLITKPDDAEREYKDAIARFSSLVDEFPKAEYRSALGNAWNWLGEVLRTQTGRERDAEQAYNSAFAIQQALTQGADARTPYAEELARTLYNRGILLSAGNEGSRAQADFRAAIAILEPAAADSPQAAQELARAYNNLGSVLSLEADRSRDVRELWEKAIAIDERLLQAQPGSRELTFELATFTGNLAALLNELGEREAAGRRSAQALQLLDGLARSAPSVAVARADAYTLHGAILVATDRTAARREFTRAVDQFASMATDPSLRQRPDYRLRLSDLLLHLAAFARTSPADDEAARLLARGTSTCLDVVESMSAMPGSTELQATLETITGVLSAVRATDRAPLETRLRALNQGLGGATPRAAR